MGRTNESELATGDGNTGDGKGNCDEEYKPGEKIKHDKYGEGVIIAVETSILTIAFAHPHGIIKIMKGHKSIKKIEE